MQITNIKPIKPIAGPFLLRCFICNKRVAQIRATLREGWLTMNVSACVECATEENLESWLAGQRIGERDAREL